MAIGSVTSQNAARSVDSSTSSADADATSTGTSTATKTASVEPPKSTAEQGVVDAARQGAAALGDAVRQRIDGSFDVAGGKKVKACGPRGGRCTAQGPTRGLGGGDSEFA